MTSLYIERLLLVVGAQNTGKSTQLRSMFLDPRFGTSSQIPLARNVAQTQYLSTSRRLYLRLTSPHEAGETLSQYLNKIAQRTASGRWCVASAVQINPARQMPALPEVVKALAARFAPERIRIAILSPDRHAATLPGASQLVDDLWRIRHCEPFCLDARSRTANGLMLADTFDFA
jgi:hypothetical protein